MHIVSLGDSITYGEGASSPARAYPSVLTALMHSQLPSRSCCDAILAEPGWTSADLLAALAAAGGQPLANARAITIWIGGDDLAQAALTALASARKSVPIAPLVTRYKHHLTELVRIAQAGRGKTVIVCTQYNPFPNSPLAVAAVATLNDAIGSVAAATGAALAPVADWFAGRQRELIRHYRTGTLADVGRGPAPVHPNDRGHRVIADGLYRMLAPIVSR
ncbi:lysophospholipase L1-like esterase [Alicyclobacillus sacchari]|uniref:Lysophospholipase L1-like esterase n=1 Tax=Alicyclobacillus sacchari TaxID=392010 RepID=A0A4V3HEN5_9BACL|nr:SGNH/GDSL hydrolase family protein [Alicyclobacillus sacchari]TDY49581.1 lysophospholipase L1-like esterase [Alicyclobacillus sacchari]GMA58550.1 hypothetical protein GCM10025858_30530 [Alicyclobacillus sacchari]